MTDKAIRAAKLTLGAVMDKRRAQTAKDRAGGQIAPSKYLPGVPRQFHADGGDATMTPAQIKAQMELSEDGGQKAQAALDAVNTAGRIGSVAGRLSGIPLGGIFGRRVAEEIAAQSYADGGSVSDARATFLAGNHPLVPDVLYHGTTPKIATKGWTDEIDPEQTQRNIDAHDFREFRPSAYGNYGPGIYMTDSPKTASDYAQGIRADQKEVKPHGQVLKLHASIKQPFHDGILRHPAWIDYIKGEINQAQDWRSGRRQDVSEKKVADALIEKLNNGTATVRDLFLHDAPEGTMVNQFGQDRIHKTIRNSGFDGIIAHRPDGSREFVAFHPTQVKSAIGNRGTFDPTNPDMTYADGGMVDDQDEDITAYHGSPHDFDAFDISKLGTGEGAQSYGHGLYFAGNEGVAKSYRDVLSSSMSATANSKNPHDIASGALRLTGGDRAGAAKMLRDNLSDVDLGSSAEYFKAAASLLESGEDIKPPGHMYKVKLRVKPHELLDWDKPLSQQHPNVRAAIKDIGVDTGAREWKTGANLGNGNRLIVTPHPDLPDDEQFAKYEMQTPLGVRINLDRRDVERLLGKGDDLTGAQIHQRLVDMGNQQGAIGEHLRAGNPMKSGPKWAAEALMRHGIKGIRYLDANSRLSTADKQTHNYVMFHHDPVKVVDKYEYGGAVEKSGGGSTGDEDDNPTDLSAARALRNFNQNSTGPTAAAEGVFNRLAAARDAAASAHEEAIKDGVFKSAQIGDVFKYKPLDTYAPMKVVDHGMVHVSRWGGINPPKYVYQDHFPVAEVQYQDASKERRKVPIELLEDRSRYDFISGKPRIARADGGRLDLYSKAARIIRGMKDQKMDVADILKYATGKGAKKTEIAHVDVPPGKATPSQVAEHIEFMQPQIGVHKREIFYRYRDPERYERQINYLEGQGRYDEAEELNREFEAFEGYGGKDAPLYAKYQLPGGENYREHVLTLDSHPDDQTYTAPIHWGKLKNPLAHIRMSDRMIGNKKILHIEELQSDWNNDARKVGFRTGREKQDYEDYVAQMRQKAIDKVKARTGQNYYDPMTGEVAPTMSPMVAQAQIEKYQRMDPYTLALKMGVQDEHRRMADAAKGGSGVPRAPYINPDKDDAAELAMKHVLMEAAKGGYDGIAFTPDEEQELRWPGHTFKGIYNKRLPGIAQRLVQPHDPDNDLDDMTHLNGRAVPMIPLSDKARDSITQNGFSSFRRGGMVDAALGVTRRFTKDGQHVTMRLKD